MDRRRSWIQPDLLRLLAAASSWGFAYSCFFLLPKYLDQELHAGPTEIGIVMGIFGLGTVTFTPLAGRVVDRFPHRRTILVGALLMSFSAFGFLAVDSTGAAILVLRVVQSLSHVLVFTAVGVAVVDLAPPERLSQALGISGASMLVMNAIAPAMVEPLAALAGWRAVFLLAAGVALASAVLAWRLPKTARPATSGPAPSAGLLAVLRRPFTIRYAIVVALAGLAFGTIFTFQQPYALSLGREEVRGFFIAFAVGAIGVRLAFGSVPDRFGRHRVATASLALYALGALGMATLGARFLDPLGAILGVAHGFFFPSLNAIAMTAIHRAERGRMMAIFTGAFNLGFASTVVLGIVAEHTGYGPVFVLAAAIAGGGMTLLVGSRVIRAADSRDPGAALAA